ncbi:MAG: alpha/beta fold hydrolase [Asticcacaulis sp.]
MLIHGLGGTWRSWDLVLPHLNDREVIAIDLPGHGSTPAEADSGTFTGLCGSVERFLTAEGLEGAALAGASLGGRIVLELARRGRSGAVVALDPGGFWEGFERNWLDASLMATGMALRLLKPAFGFLVGNPVTRTVMMAQLSARPWALPGGFAAGEWRSLVETQTYNALVSDLYHAPMQRGPASKTSGPVTIGWGRQDRLCPPIQAERAVAAFPGANLHWFEKCGHYPPWDQPQACARLIVEATGDAAYPARLR